MIIEFKDDALNADIERISAKLCHAHRELRRVELAGRLFLAVFGERSSIDRSLLMSDPSVKWVSPPEITAYFCRREFQPTGTRSFMVGDIKFGSGDLLLIAGPCAVEDRDQLLETARLVKAAGAHIFRAGAFKPRTSPYNFQGLGRAGLELLSEVREMVHIPVVSEVLDSYDIDAAEESVDMLQVGTRNMTNQALLKRLGKCRRPVLLKRGFSSSLEELIRAAEFITVHGNPNVALCERGIQTFETATRYTLDLSAVPALRKMTHLPIVVDPSHGTGRKDLVPDMARAAAVVGADAIMVEVYVDPEAMIRPGDGHQTLLPDEFKNLVDSLVPILEACGRRLRPAVEE